MMSIVDEFIDWAHVSLLECDHVQEYLAGRGVSESQWKRHRIGYVVGEYCPDAARDHNHDLRTCSERERMCDGCRFVRWSSSYADGQQTVGARIVGSIVLPLTSYSGTSVGFQIRFLKERSFDSFTVKRRPEGYFFGIAPNMEAIWATREVTLVEGPFDQLVFERLVGRNVIALTTSAIGTSQIRFLRRFVRTVNVCLDADVPGRDGTRKAMKRLRDLNVRDLRCPSIRKGDKDPSDFWKAGGDERFASFFRERMRELI